MLRPELITWTLGGIRKGIYDDHPNRDRNPDGMLPTIIHSSQASESEASLHLVKRREGHLKGKVLLRSLELQNGRLHNHLNTWWSTHYCLVLGFLFAHISNGPPDRHRCLLQVRNGDGGQAIQPTVHQSTSERRTVSAVEELEVVFGIDVINKPGISGFVRIDVTAAKVERIGELSRNSLCFYGEAVCVGRMSLEQRL
ncbi:hypothetical protein C4D60_Mb03t10850 [Musa balbisiana]|uniref:Uncharacterized protein n=1 Tax=Musa balbisiana TaxID=52838 RepID=A0A4S8JBF3_MUSBA|nr:hypothetical protein C4D60_Mb03t10850 [Musa balbisiana]